MFEKIVIRRSENGPGITVGELAEALLFYQNVHIVLDFHSVASLIRALGLSGTLSLLKRPNVSAVYFEQFLGMRTDTSGEGKVYSFVTINLAGSKNIPRFQGKKERLAHLIQREGFTGREAKRFADQFREKVPFREYSDDTYVKGGILKAAHSDMFDTVFVREAVRIALNQYDIPNSIPSDLRFEAYPVGQGFRIETNIDLTKIGNWFKETKSSSGDFTPAHLILDILTARADMLLASRYGGEFYTSNLVSQIVRLRYRELLQRAEIEQKELREFREIILPGVPSIREAINHGERSFDDFSKLLDRAARFREWLRGVNPDSKIVEAYLSEVKAGNWLSSLPARTLRYIVTLGTGAVSPATGAIASAVDTFLIERILGGWRPNHFVEKRLAPFLDPEK